MASGTKGWSLSWRVVAAGLALATIGLGLAGCGSSTRSATDTTETTDSSGSSTETSGVTTTYGPSAADALAGFFTSAEDTDQRLHDAADAVNGGIGTDTVTFDDATIAAVRGADPRAVAAAIPAGMDPTLERAVLLVYSGLVSRFDSLDTGNCLRPGTFPRSELDAQCFSEGHVAAERFERDLAAVRSIAGSLPPQPPPAPDSRTAGELAVRVAYIGLANGGCDSGGGYLATDAIPVDWQADGDWDGHVGQIPFQATYDTTTGWKVNINAC